MRKYLLIILTILIASPCRLHPPSGWAQLEVLDSSNLAQNVIQVAKLVEEIRILNDQLMVMNKNTLSTTTAYQDVTPLLWHLGLLLQRAQALGYSVANVDEIFIQRYPGYTPYKDWHVEYGVWTTTALDTLRASLSTLNVHAENFESEAERVQGLKNVSDNAIGRKAAIQATNAMSAELLNRINLLKQVSMTHANMYAVVEAKKADVEAQEAAHTREWLLNGQKPMPAYGTGGVRQIPAP